MGTTFENDKAFSTKIIEKGKTKLDSCNCKKMNGQALIELLVSALIIAAFFILVVELSKTVIQQQEKSRFHTRGKK